jgi:beta-lactamase regulating signal transducer with metallopeptidase domain
MRYKRLATAIYLCITLTTLSALVKAEQTASFNKSQYQSVETSRLNTQDSAVQTASRVDSRVTPGILDSLWILGFTVAGLVLLRKVQGE